MVSVPPKLNVIDGIIHIEQHDPPRSPRDVLPTMYDLPSEDPEEPGLPDEFHDLQPQLLSRTLSLTGYSRENCFTASDLNLYYNVRHPLWHKRPDWFLVVDVPRLYEQRDLRRSYVLWQEGNPPTVVVEFLSPGTEAEDLGRFYDGTVDGSESEATTSVSSAVASNEDNEATKAKPPGKFEVYETRLRVPHYFVYNRFTQRLRYFKLEGGQYGEQTLSSEPPLVWLTDLEIGLGIWQGEFEGVTAAWLRWCDQDGHWLLTDTEQERQAKEQERLTREQAQQQFEQAQTQLLQAAQNLLATGMELEQVAQILNLSESQTQSLRSLD
ncbi:MAG: Uma2 family endonuclease [Stenomitos rutilans HA7619-LM2]|nr:Uma2 family endonuclease [Stenomitos rutilans HA7619-LM2]